MAEPPWKETLDAYNEAIIEEQAAEIARLNARLTQLESFLNHCRESHSLPDICCPNT